MVQKNRVSGKWGKKHHIFDFIAVCCHIVKINFSRNFWEIWAIYPVQQSL